MIEIQMQNTKSERNTKKKKKNTEYSRKVEREICSLLHTTVVASVSITTTSYASSMCIVQ